MNEKDLLPAILLHHAHLVPEDPADALRLPHLAVHRVHLRRLLELAEGMTGLHHAPGLDSRVTEIVGGDHRLIILTIVQ